MDVPAFEPSPWIISDLIDRGWSTIPDFLPERTIRILATETRERYRGGAFHPAAVGRGHEEQRRSETRADHVLWLEEASSTTAQLAYFSHMEAMRLQIEASLFLGMATLEAHLALFPIGAFYHRHTDALAGKRTRILSTVLYLNDGWLATEGGGLRIYVTSSEGEETHDIAPLAGTMVLFLSDELEHEVLPATRERLSITGWMLRR